MLSHIEALIAKKQSCASWKFEPTQVEHVTHPSLGIVNKEFFQNKATSRLA
jgi:hypothetical protein